MLLSLVLRLVLLGAGWMRMVKGPDIDAKEQTFCKTALVFFFSAPQRQSENLYRAQFLTTLPKDKKG